MAKLERRDLVSAAKELIDVMDLKDKGTPIKITKETTIEELETIIKEAIPLIDPKTDKFEDETQAVIDELSKPTEAEAEPEDETQQEVAEKIHKKNVADAPVNKGKKVKEEPEEELPEIDDEKLKEELAEEEKTDKKAKKESKEKPKQLKKAGEPGKPGVIATIVSLIEKSGKKGITKTEILEELKEIFPDRPVDSMKATINVQVPARITKEKFPIKKLEGERWAKA